MDPLFIQQLSKFSQQLCLLNEYIELKFGSDFKEFLTFKASRPNAGIILVSDDGSHRPFRDNHVDICGVVNNDDEEPEDFKNQREDEDEVEIGEQGVSFDWGPPPVVKNVYTVKPEDVSVPAFDDNDYNDNDQDEDGKIPSSLYQMYNRRRYQVHNGDDNDDEGDDPSSAVYGHHDDESIRFFTNSSPQDEHDNQDQDSFGISPTPTTTTPTPNNPTTIRPKRKTLSVNPPPKAKKCRIMKNIGNVIINPNNEVIDSKENLTDEEIINPENENPPAKNTVRMWDKIMTNGNQVDHEEQDDRVEDDGKGWRPPSIFKGRPQAESKPTPPSSGSEYDDEDQQEQQDDSSDDDDEEWSLLPSTKNYTRKATNPTRKSETSRARQDESSQRKRKPYTYIHPSDYPRAKIPKNKRSKVYAYFDFNETLRMYICKQCKISLTCGGTGKLHRHLKRAHVDLHTKLRNEDTSQ